MNPTTPPPITSIAYWRQKASPWVSAAVLGGGLVSAIILFGLFKVQEQAVASSNYSLGGSLASSSPAYLPE